MSRENRNSKRSVEYRKENRSNLEHTNRRDHQSKTNDIRRFSREIIGVQPTADGGKMNNRRSVNGMGERKKTEDRERALSSPSERYITLYSLLRDVNRPRVVNNRKTENSRNVFQNENKETLVNDAITDNIKKRGSRRREPNRTTDRTFTEAKIRMKRNTEQSLASRIIKERNHSNRSLLEKLPIARGIKYFTEIQNFRNYIFRTSLKKTEVVRNRRNFVNKRSRRNTDQQPLNDIISGERHLTHQVKSSRGERKISDKERKSPFYERHIKNIREGTSTMSFSQISDDNRTPLSETTREKYRRDVTQIRRIRGKRVSPGITIDAIQSRESHVRSGKRVQNIRSVAARDLITREFRNFDRHAVIPFNVEYSKQRLVRHSDEEKRVSRKAENFRKLERDLRSQSVEDKQIRHDIESLKLKKMYSSIVENFERRIMHNMERRMKVGNRKRELEAKNTGGHLTVETTARNLGIVKLRKIKENALSAIRNIRISFSQHMKEKVQSSDRNGKGSRTKINLFRQFSDNRRMRPVKKNESFTYIVQNVEGKLSGDQTQNRITRTERNIKEYHSENYELRIKSFKLSKPTRSREVQILTERKSRKIPLNFSRNFRNSCNRIYESKMREKTVTTDRIRRALFQGKLRNTQRQIEPKEFDVKLQDRFMETEKNDMFQRKIGALESRSSRENFRKQFMQNVEFNKTSKEKDRLRRKYTIFDQTLSNVIKQNGTPMNQRNSRGFRGKFSNFVRLERTFKREYNYAKLYITMYYPEQDISIRIFKQVKSNARFTVSRRNTQKFIADRNSVKITSNQRVESTKKISSNLIFSAVSLAVSKSEQAAVSTLRRNRHSRQLNFAERPTPARFQLQSLPLPSFSVNLGGSQKVLTHSATHSRVTTVERYMEKAKPGSRNTHGSGVYRETGFENIHTRQGKSNSRLEVDTILPIHDALEFIYKPRYNIFENRLISPRQPRSSHEGHFNTEKNWNRWSIASFTAHLILGLVIVLATSERDPLKSRPFRERLFDALSLRADVF